MNKDTIRSTLNQFDREKFADWLWRGLRSFYTSPSSERIRTFDGAGILIVQQESLCEGLARVYEECTQEPKQVMFRQAIGDVLRDQANNPNAPFDAFRDLIYLIARIRATESLSALLPTVGTGYLGKHYPNILYDTVAVLRSLAPSTQAYKTAFSLINCANFDDGYLFEAMKVLVECEPSCASEIVLKLEPRLSQLRQAAQERGGDEWTAFCEVAADWAGTC